MRTRRVLLPALATWSVCAITVLAGSPAEATEVVDCSAGPVSLAEPYGVYQLVGACSQVSIEAPNTTVSLAGAARIDVNGTVVTGTRATLTGTGGRVEFSRLTAVHVTGSANHVVVRKGVTRVSDTGTDNHIRVHARPRPPL